MSDLQSTQGQDTNGSTVGVESCKRGCCASQKEHYRSLNLAVGTIKSKVESQFAKDREAYRRLRQNGLQPPRIDGCAMLENATTKAEIESGHLVRKGEVCRPSQVN
jgi:hypothetical protein